MQALDSRVMRKDESTSILLRSGRWAKRLTSRWMLRVTHLSAGTQEMQCTYTTFAILRRSRRF
jgi:hypothetical protein